MHELLLFGQVRPAQHFQVLSILAGIAAMQPQPILERHLVFKPASRPPGSARTGPVESSILGMADAQLYAFHAHTKGDTFFVKLVGDLKPGKGREKEKEKEKGKGNGGGIDDEHGDVEMDVKMEPGDGKREEDVKPQIKVPAREENLTDETSHEDPEKWLLQFRDVPDVPGRRPVASRLVADYHLTSNDPVGFMSVLDYSHTSTFHVSGHRFTHLYTSLILSRVHIPASSPSETSRLLDPSGTYLLQVSLRVQDGSKPELMSRGISELVALRDMLKGVVELVVPDRLSLDTRLR